MKKVLLIILIVIVSSVCFAVQLVVNLFGVYPYIFPAVIFSAAAAFGMAGFYKPFRNKVGLGAPLFWVITYAQQFAFGMGYFIVSWYMASTHYFFLGAGALVAFYDMPVSAAAYALGGVVFTAVDRAREKGRTQT